MYAELVGNLIKTGVMQRLFNQFDFFSVSDRDQLSPRSAHLRKNREKPPKCGKRVDIFGDVKWDFEYARDQDDDSSEKDSSDSDESDHLIQWEDNQSFIGQKRSQVEDYEVFLFGFFYFFILQDPLIIQPLNEPNIYMATLSTHILQDLHFFNKNYLVQWVQIKPV